MRSLENPGTAMVAKRRTVSENDRPARRRKPVPRRLGVKAKFWLTFGPQTLFGDGKADLLEAVDRLGSLRRAAASMSMSYRYAWGLLRELDTAAGFPFLEHSGSGARTNLRFDCSTTIARKAGTASAVIRWGNCLMQAST